MSQENVELVRQLQPGPDMDLAHVVRDERLATAWIEAGAPFFHSDFECALRWIDTDPTTYPGLDGMRTGWLDWLAPWVQFRTEVEDVLDAGDRVLVLTPRLGTP